MEILVVDIVDAFLNSRTQEEERAYAIFTNEEHYYAPPSLTITTSASTTNLGAILACPKGRPQAWFADLIWEEDLARFGATAGDPAWMAEFELLAILVALAA